MSLLGFGKKEEDFNSLGLPELPSMPERRSLPELPSMPSTSLGNRFNNEMVKSAVIDNTEDNMGNMPSSEDYYSMMEKTPTNQQIIQKPRQNELVWVRIDKFQEAQRDFNEVKGKVREIELLLKEVRAINQKEDAQVSEWVKDLEKVKTLLIDVDSKVFNQL